MKRESYPAPPPDNSATCKLKPILTANDFIDKTDDQRASSINDSTGTDAEIHSPGRGWST